MISFQPVSPTVFVYKTSPSYWQVQQEEPAAAAAQQERQQETSSNDKVNTSTGFTTTSNKALRNFSETDDPSCLCWAMQVSSQAHDLTVQALPVDEHASTWRLRIACLYKGQTVVMDRQIREPKSRIQKMTAHLSATGTLTVVIPKLIKTTQSRNRTTTTSSTRTVIPIPVRSYLSQSITTTTTTRKPGIKRLELEVPCSLGAQDIQVSFHTKKRTLYISCTNPTSNKMFRRKFKLNLSQTQLEHMKASLYHQHDYKSSLLIIAAPTSNIHPCSDSQSDNASLMSYASSTSASSFHSQNRRAISIPIQHHMHDIEASLLQPFLHHHPRNCRQQISSQALASCHQSSKASSSAFQLELEYTILKNQIFESTQTMQQNIINDMAGISPNHINMNVNMNINDITTEAALAVDYCASAAADAQRQVLHNIMMTTTLSSPTHLLRRLV